MFYAIISWTTVFSYIVDRLTRGESICQDEVFDDVSCVNDAVEQLFDLFADDNSILTLTKLHTLISNQLSVDHHRSVREEDHDDDHDEEQAVQNVNMHYKNYDVCLCLLVHVHTCLHSCTCTQ